MQKIGICLIAVILPIEIRAQPVMPCNVDGIGYDVEEFSLLICEGSLDHQAAIDCANKFARDADHYRKRSELAQAQAECLCRALNAAVDGSGRYNWITGQCIVEP